LTSFKPSKKPVDRSAVRDRQGMAPASYRRKAFASALHVILSPLAARPGGEISLMFSH